MKNVTFVDHEALEMSLIKNTFHKVLTENSMFFLSWLTARGSGTGSVCLMTETDSPKRVVRQKKQISATHTKNLEFSFMPTHYHSWDNVSVRKGAKGQIHPKEVSWKNLVMEINTRPKGVRIKINTIPK